MTDRSTPLLGEEIRALIGYAQHKDDCASWVEALMYIDGDYKERQCDCTCGLDSLLLTLSSSREETDQATRVDGNS